jgi:hypothetical protein
VATYGLAANLAMVDPQALWMPPPRQLFLGLEEYYLIEIRYTFKVHTSSSSMPPMTSWGPGLRAQVDMDYINNLCKLHSAALLDALG